jgi:hypothetical protein
MKAALLKYALPFFIIFIAGWQFYLVYQKNLTRWKGGGFGMYSELHPLNRQVWVGKKDSLWRIELNDGAAKGKTAKATRLCYRPDEENARNLAKFIAHEFHLKAVTIQVWEPFIEPGNNLLSRKLIKEFNYAE